MGYVFDPKKYSDHLRWPFGLQDNFDGGSLYNAVLPDGIYELNDGSRSERYSITEFTASMSFICDWKDRYSYVEVLRDSVYAPDNCEMWVHTDYDPSTGDPITHLYMRNSYFNYYLPAQVQDIQISVLGAEGGPGYDTLQWIDRNKVLHDVEQYQKFTKAKLSVSYKALARPSSATLDQTVTPQVQMRKLPPFGFYWLSDGSLVLDKEAPGKQEIKLKIQRTMSNVRSVPPVFFDLAGSVNADPVFDALTGMTFPAGTLLYMPTNMQKKMTSAIGDDDRLWNFGFELNFNPIGWNRFQRPHGVDAMMFNGIPMNLYPYKDFNLLGLNRMLEAVDEDAVVDGVENPYTGMFGTYDVILYDPAKRSINRWHVGEDGYVSLVEEHLERDRL